MSVVMTRWRNWLRHCATNGKVAGSIPDGDIGIFHWHNPSRRTGVDSASDRNGYQEYFLGVKGGRCVGLTTLPPSYARLSSNLGTSTSWKPQGPPQACNGTALPVPLILMFPSCSKIQRNKHEKESANLPECESHGAQLSDSLMQPFLTCGPRSPKEILRGPRTWMVGKSTNLFSLTSNRNLALVFHSIMTEGNKLIYGLLSLRKCFFTTTNFPI